MSKQDKEETKVTDKSIEMRVAGGSKPGKVAGAIVKYIQEGKEVSLIAMGAGAVNQAVKSICVSRGMVAPQGINLYFIPGFVSEHVEDAGKTAIKFFIKIS